MAAGQRLKPAGNARNSKSPGKTPTPQVDLVFVRFDILAIATGQQGPCPHGVTRGEALALPGDALKGMG